MDIQWHASFAFDKLADGAFTVAEVSGAKKIDSAEVTSLDRPCPRCGQLADPGLHYCRRCRVPLSDRRKVPPWHIHRLAYDWTLGWAYRPSATVALCVLSFAESIVFPVPPDVLLIPMALGNRKKWLRYAFLCSLASVAGAVAAYLIGYLAWTGIDQYVYRWFGWSGLTAENFALAAKGFEKWNFWIVFTAGFTPLPFKVFNVFAGFFSTDPQVANPMLFFVTFLLAATVSRAARFFLVAGLIRAFGAKITPFIDKYFNWLSLAFAILLVGGILLVKYVI